MVEEKDIYPNSPLIEVIFEIRFPGEPRIECNRDEFYEKIRGEFPHVLVPQIKIGDHPALQPYRFENEDNTAGIMVSIIGFSYYVRRYPGYDQFKGEALKWAIDFGKTYKISKLSRTGLRYINIIPFQRENGLIPLKRFLKIKFDLPEIYPDNFENLSLVFTSKTNVGVITTKLESVMTADRSNEAILLDFDFAKDKDLTIDLINRYLDESHAQTKQVFEELMTEEYRQYLKGKTI